MTYDANLEKRITAIIPASSHKKFTAKKMFGGIVWMLGGNMCFGIHKDNLILRLGIEKADHLIGNPNITPMDITGRAMKGWAMVLPSGLDNKDHLQEYIELAAEFVSTLPAK